jgi:hypothetical protein
MSPLATYWAVDRSNVLIYYLVMLAPAAQLSYCELIRSRPCFDARRFPEGTSLSRQG